MVVASPIRTRKHSDFRHRVLWKEKPGSSPLKRLRNDNVVGGLEKRLPVPLPPPPPWHSEPFAVAQRRERRRNLLFHQQQLPTLTTLSFRAVRSRVATRTRVGICFSTSSNSHPNHL